jgi:hypothetical protein
MRADDLAVSFNAVTERMYWRATVGGTRTNPEVHFLSRSAMVRITYSLARNDFKVSFSKTSCAWGDYMGSTFKALDQICSCLKAAGMPFSQVIEDGKATLRAEYDPRTKETTIHLANHGDDWTAETEK